MQSGKSSLSDLERKVARLLVIVALCNASPLCLNEIINADPSELKRILEELSAKVVECAKPSGGEGFWAAASYVVEQGDVRYLVRGPLISPHELSGSLPLLANQVSLRRIRNMAANALMAAVKVGDGTFLLSLARQNGAEQE